MKEGVDQILECLCCQEDTPTQGRRICPLCGHVFQSNGWDGIDAHWRAHHEAVMAYEQFWLVDVL